jgi:hypothetical protein
VAGQDHSIIAQGERAVDDFVGLWRRRKFICVLVVLILLVPALVTGFGMFWGRGSLKGQLGNLQRELDDTKRDRDSKATQLAPFLALANQRFESAPPDKRLDLLFDRVDKLMEAVRETATKLPGRRHLTEDGIKRIREKLDFAPRLDVEVGGIMGDMESLDLAAQIKETFEGSGFKVRELSQYVPKKEGVFGVSYYCKQELDPRLADAIRQLFVELSEEPMGGVSDHIVSGKGQSNPAPDLKIVVGAK